MDAKERTCSEADCDRPHWGLGYCRMHYKRFKRNGTTAPIDRSRGTCSLEGCDKPHNTHGLCSMHVTRLKRTGSTELKTRIPLMPHGPANAAVLLEGDCKIWEGKKFSSGYGYVTSDGKATGVHRLEWQKHFGDPSEGMMVDHICRNRACYNIDHLRLVTRKQNVENRSYVRKDGLPVGVSYRKETGRWRVRVLHNGETHHGGSYPTLEEAAEVARNMRNALFTHNELDRRQHMVPTG